jgi:DNA-binding transcriptional LysR family regulator
MDLWQLHVFCRVVEEKSFSQAGRRIHLSQPTISSHIKDLETHFGCRLIDRLAKEAVPTQAGELLYAYARKLLLLKEEAESALAGYLGKMKGALAVGGSTIPGGYILPRDIGKFTRTYPQIRISLSIGDTEDITRAILSGMLDMGIVGAQASNRQLIQEPLIDDDMRLIVPGDHPWASRDSVTLEMLRETPFITRETGSGTLRSIELSLNQKGLDLTDLTIALQVGSTVSVVQAIKGRAGVSILSTVAVTEDIEAGTLRALRVDGMDLRRSFYLTRLKNRSISPIGQAFISFLKETYQPGRWNGETPPVDEQR